jgi:DNA-binding PadR family transcriptional regulator
LTTQLRDPAEPTIVLAAVDRAVRQRPFPPFGGPPGATLGEILAHLDVGRRSGTARAVRQTLAALADEGQVEHGRRRGVAVFALTTRGRRRLERARRAAGGSLPLPESPQHRAWREARELAASELPVLTDRLREAVADTRARLGSDAEGRSDDWLELAERLRASARGVGSALYCLQEWPEPDEAGPDVDDLREPGDETMEPEARTRLRQLRTGRRNPRTWLW